MSIRENERPGAVQDHHTLLDVAQTLITLFQLRPAKAEQFMTDWLHDWLKNGAYPSFTVAKVSQAAFWELMGRFMSRYVDYLTTEQRVKFVLDNLPSMVANDNFQKCVSALITQCPDHEAAELLRSAGEAADILTSSQLRAVLGDIAGPVIES